jgi:hypothetical protein
MKKLVFVVLFSLFVAALARAQEVSQYGGNAKNQQDKIREAGEDAESKLKDSIKSEIKVWTLGNQFSTAKPALLDTSTINFHIYSPLLQQSISNTSLGFTGSSYQSNIFFKRERNEDFYFLRNSAAYRRSQSEVEYYNTTTPYANLMYVQGDQGSSRTEQVFKAFFTRNIDSLTNYGFRYNTIYNQSQYQSLEGGHKFFNVFASRNAPRYNGYISVMNGKDVAFENGGISASTVNRRYSPYQQGVQLQENLENTVATLSLFTSHEYIMGEVPFLQKPVPDSVKPSFVPRYAVQYSVELNTYERALLEPSINTTYFDTVFFKRKGTHTDSSTFRRFTHILQFKVLEDENRKFTFGKRAFLENEIVSASHPLLYGQRTYRYGNVYAGGEVYKRNSNFWQWSGLARFAVLGRNLGDALLKGTIDKPIVLGKDTTFLQVQGWYQDVTADIYQEHWSGNHYKWENNFKKQHEVVVDGSYSYPRFHLSGGANYTLLSNYLYNNEKALPAQYNNEFSIFSGWLNKDFVVGRFVWSNKAVWQEVSDDSVLHLPVWNFYSSIYYSHYLYKVMKIQLGAEIYYHTKFYADSYEPSTTQFYLQNHTKTGGYPMINLYANAKLKRTSAFVILSHANSLFDMGNFISSPAYPLDQMAFKFGFFWTFYD